LNCELLYWHFWIYPCWSAISWLVNISVICIGNQSIIPLIVIERETHFISYSIVRIFICSHIFSVTLFTGAFLYLLTYIFCYFFTGAFSLIYSQAHFLWFTHKYILLFDSNPWSFIYFWPSRKSLSRRTSEISLEYCRGIIELKARWSYIIVCLSLSLVNIRILLIKKVIGKRRVSSYFCHL
jgi:hypothetical protein